MSDRTIGVGILGTGFARTTQIPCFQATPGFEVVGLYSRNMTRAYDLAQEFGLRRAFDDVERMLKVEEIELVCVSTPPHLHLPQTLAALRAGKHVLCEKPTALHAGEAQQMWEEAKKSGRLTRSPSVLHSVRGGWASRRPVPGRFPSSDRRCDLRGPHGARGRLGSKQERSAG